MAAVAYNHEIVVQIQTDNGDVLFERRPASSMSDSCKSGTTSPKAGVSSTSLSSAAPKSPSLLRMKFLPRLGSKEKLPTVEISENMDRLREIIADRKLRQELISQLVALKSDDSVKVRFISAVEEFERTTDKGERKAKGNKIVAMFVHRGSMFQLATIPPHLMQPLQSLKLDKLIDLRNYLLDDLIRNPVVIKLMKEMVPQRVLFSYAIPS